MHEKVRKAMRWFFLGKTDSKPLKVINIIVDLFVVYFLLVWFAPGLFFRNSYKIGNITFKCAAYSKYDGGTGEAEFRAACDEAMKAISRSELYDADRKITVIFCPGHTTYKFMAINPFETSIGFRRPTLPAPVIMVNKTSFKEMTAYGGAKENNTRKLPALLAHETTHVFCKGLVHLWTPSWKKEGICDYVAADSSFPVQEGWQHFLSDERVKTRSYKYFLYRVAVTYMRDVEGMSFSAIVADKRKMQEVLDSVRKYVQESGIRLF